MVNESNLSIKELRVGNMIRDMYANHELILDKDLINSYKFGKMIWEGIPLYDKKFNLRGSFSFEKDAETNNNLISSDNKITERTKICPSQLILHIEVKEESNCILYSYKTWIMYRGKRVYLKYVHELQNFLMDAYSIESNFQVVPI